MVLASRSSELFRFQIEEKTRELLQRNEILNTEVQILRQEKRTLDAILQSVTVQRDMLKSALESGQGDAERDDVIPTTAQPPVTSTPSGVSPTGGSSFTL